MDLLLLLKALVLGLVEGLTEFLPVSSTGHLIILEDLLGFTGEKAKVFTIFIQLGAILAIVWAYRNKIGEVVAGLPRDPKARRFALNLVIAFLPAAVLGFLFGGRIKEFLFHPFNVAVALIVGALVIFLVERFKRPARVESVDDLGWADALKIGFAQSVALIPGTSRSGATIMGGLVFGLSRKAATEFSFFLAIPTMFAATSYDLLKNLHTLSAQDVLPFATGFLAAFAAALFAVRALLRFVSTHSFIPFAWYRLVLGAAVLAYYW